MRETPDPLEAELSALRPHEVSPGLRRRVAESLAESSPVPGRRLGRLVFAGGLAAACLAAILLWWEGRRPRHEDPAPSPPTNNFAHQDTPRPPDDSDRLAPWRVARRVLDGAEMPPFTWPLEETSPLTVSTSMPPDLLH